MKCFQCFRSPKSEEEKDYSSEEGVGDSRREGLASSTSVTTSIPESLGNSDMKNEDPVGKGGDKTHNAANSFMLWELAAITNDFNIESLVGMGNYGRVYKGEPLKGDQVVAVKQLDQDGVQGKEEIFANFISLSHLNHPNLVNLIGYCADDDERLLVYEFMPLGSLEDHLHDLPPNKKPLDWNTRMKIAAGVAQGLEYLHNQINPPVIYRFIKSSNILLGEGYHPKLSDVGLEIFFPTRAMTAYGYCAPESILEGNLTVESDVYSFGVLLLELITGRKAIDSKRCYAEQLLVAWAGPLLVDETKFSSLADPLLQGQFPPMSLHEALYLVVMCLDGQEANRPPIEYVVDKAKYLASQTYDPKTAAAQSYTSSSSTPRPKESEINPAGVSHDQRSSHDFSYNVGSTVSKADGASSWKGKDLA
ncbi:probable serine/threonine-protein kinase PBL7 [Typha latifolia]|uniref:probable serine/threonine-protein kinase PBL7 n=1 Tax=Typha latifolia TaxID=4733 RepID=UPI003C2DE82E